MLSNERLENGMVARPEYRDRPDVDDTVVCSRCGHWEYKDDAVEDGNDGWLCENCAGKYATDREGEEE